MITDIERLHRVVDQREQNKWSRERCTGKSFAKCHDVAGMVELELFNVIVVIMTNYDDVDYIFPMLWDVFQDHQLESTKVDRYTLKCNDTLIKFFAERDTYKIQAYGACGVVEIGHYN